MSQQKQACCATFLLCLLQAHAQIAVKDAAVSLLNFSHLFLLFWCLYRPVLPTLKIRNDEGEELMKHFASLLDLSHPSSLLTAKVPETVSLARKLSRSSESDKAGPLCKQLLESHHDFVESDEEEGDGKEENGVEEVKSGGSNKGDEGPRGVSSGGTRRRRRRRRSRRGG